MGTVGSKKILKRLSRKCSLILVDTDGACGWDAVVRIFEDNSRATELINLYIVSRRLKGDGMFTKESVALDLVDYVCELGADASLCKSIIPPDRLTPTLALKMEDIYNGNFCIRIAIKVCVDDKLHLYKDIISVDKITAQDVELGERNYGKLYVLQ